MSSLTVSVEVVLVQPSFTQRKTLLLKNGTLAREAVLLAAEQGIDFQASGITPENAALGVYSVRVDDSFVLADGDRLELYRPLEQDPMDLRRRRAKQSALRR